MALGETVNLYANNVPSQLLSVKPESNSIPVRRFTFALENVIAQLNQRIPEVTEKYINACSYKFSGPQRHQMFWRHFRHLKSLLGKYNNNAMQKTLTDLHKRISSSTARSYYYLPTVDALRYIASTYLAQIYILRKLRDCCVQTAEMMLGYIEMGHWENLGLFILSLCAEIHSLVPTQAKAISSVYDSLAEFVVAADPNFPSSAAEVPGMTSLLSKPPSATAAETERVLALLKMTEEQMDAAKLQNEMAKMRAEIIQNQKPSVSDFLETTVDLGVTIERDEVFTQDDASCAETRSVEVHVTEEEVIMTKKKAKKRKQTSSVDSAIADVSITVAEETTVEEVFPEKRKKKKKKLLAKKEDTLLADSSVFDESVVSQPVVKNKKMKKLKRKLEGSEPERFPVSSTPLIKKKKKRMLDLSMSTINSETEATPSVLKKKKKKKVKTALNGETMNVGADSSFLVSSSSSTLLKKKKKKSKKAASDL